MGRASFAFSWLLSKQVTSGLFFTEQPYYIDEFLIFWVDRLRIF